MAMLFIALALFVGVFLVTNPARYTPKAGNTIIDFSKIQNDSDLERASSSLDSININSIESVVEQNQSDASSF